MINADDFDMEAAHDWAISSAHDMGCTCANEPTIAITNCEAHGVHLAHYHDKECYLSIMEKARRHIDMAEWN